VSIRATRKGVGFLRTGPSSGQCDSVSDMCFVLCLIPLTALENGRARDDCRPDRRVAIAVQSLHRLTGIALLIRGPVHQALHCSRLESQMLFRVMRQLGKSREKTFVSSHKTKV
jgi:hypothetical protein